MARLFACLSPAHYVVTPELLTALSPFLERALAHERHGLIHLEPICPSRTERTVGVFLQGKCVSEAQFCAPCRFRLRRLAGGTCRAFSPLGAASEDGWSRLPVLLQQLGAIEDARLLDAMAFYESPDEYEETVEAESAMVWLLGLLQRGDRALHLLRRFSFGRL